MEPEVHCMTPPVEKTGMIKPFLIMSKSVLQTTRPSKWIMNYINQNKLCILVSTWLSYQVVISDNQSGLQS